MFWVIFTIFFAILFSIFFLLPDSSTGQTGARGQPIQQANESSSSEPKEQKQTVHSAYQTYSTVLKEMSAKKLAETNSSTKRRVTIHLNGLHFSQSEFTEFISFINNMAEQLKVLFLYSTDEMDLVTQKLVESLKKEFKESNFVNSKSAEGLHSVLRQLNPRIHLETQESLIAAMKIHLNKVLFIHPTSSHWEVIQSQHNHKHNIHFAQNIHSALLTLNTLIK